MIVTMKNKVYLHGEAKKVKQKRIISTRRQHFPNSSKAWGKSEILLRGNFFTGRREPEVE